MESAVMTTTRREALQLGVVGALGVAGLGTLEASALAEKGEPSNLAPRNRPVPFRALFMRPPELLPYETGIDEEEGGPVEKFAVTGQFGQLHILPGLTTTVAGYNGIFPGPTIRVQRGVRTQLRVRNAFPRAGLIYPQQIELSTHLHGSPSKPQYDGYANDITVPDNVKNYHYPNDESARTLWYHDHRHIVTTQNVYSGLAALYPMHDQFEQAQLPQGEFDVPFVLSDALFHADGSLAFNDNGHLGNWGRHHPGQRGAVADDAGQAAHLSLPASYRHRRTLLPAHLVQRRPLHIVGTDGA
jgi:FtsP/CotA-like multicopper oxidase with cupredoxin domain